MNRIDTFHGTVQWESGGRTGPDQSDLPGDARSGVPAARGLQMETLPRPVVARQPLVLPQRVALVKDERRRNARLVRAAAPEAVSGCGS